jgi:hypothetical protein
MTDEVQQHSKTLKKKNKVARTNERRIETTTETIDSQLNSKKPTDKGYKQAYERQNTGGC